MSALILVVIASFFIEFSTAISKKELAEKKESIYAVAFLSGIWSTILFVGIAIIRSDAFVFSLESLPTFSIRAVLEIALVFVSIAAVREADRSTFTFLRMLTLPLLLVIDLSLGYSLTLFELAGIGLLILAPTFLITRHSLSPRGKIYALTSATIAAISISLYKYNITHFNSVEAEQALMHAILLVAIISAAWFRGHENVFRYLTHPICLVQSFAAGIAGVCMSFAYAFSIPSLVIAMKRSFELVWSLIFGKLYFHESHIMMKALALLIAFAGIVIITT